MFIPWNSFSACLLAKNDRIGRARLDLVNQGHVNPLRLEVHRESGGFTACNACPARPVECETYSSGVGQNDRTGACPACPVAPEDGTGVGSGNPTGVNSFSACLLAKSDRIGADRIDLLNRGDAIPLGLAPWNETCPTNHLPFRSIATSLGQNLYHRGKVIPSGFGHSLSRYHIKLHQLTTRVEPFLL